VQWFPCQTLPLVAARSTATDFLFGLAPDRSVIILVAAEGYESDMVLRAESLIWHFSDPWRDTMSRLGVEPPFPRAGGFLGGLL
jgi:hypothetical protein